MPEIEIRPAVSTDIDELIKMDHRSNSDYVWQMEIAHDSNQINIAFREIRLPRPLKLDYPRRPGELMENWQKHSILLVALVKNEIVGYISLNESREVSNTHIHDFVVAPNWRRLGIGSALIIAAQDWSQARGFKRCILEIQAKNNPAIRLALRLAYDFCGFQDHYFYNHDIALFFCRTLG
jgi:GNAT superfamily N-acetyltransferase